MKGIPLVSRFVRSCSSSTATQGELFAPSAVKPMQRTVVELGDLASGVRDDGELDVDVRKLVDAAIPVNCRPSQRERRGTYSAIHSPCDLSSLHERPIVLTPRFSNSGWSLATSPSSVVQTCLRC